MDAEVQAMMEQVQREEEEQFYKQVPAENKSQQNADFVARTICVRNLPSSVEINDLGNLFSDMGQIDKITKIVDDDFIFTGVAYIVYGTLEEAQRAVPAKNGARVNGNIITVSMKEPEQQQQQQQQQEPQKKELATEKDDAPDTSCE